MADERVFIGDLTRKEFRRCMQQGLIRAAIVPTAATEQHDEHLEMIHDALHATYGRAGRPASPTPGGLYP